jgi:hypothetical protein
MSSSTLIAIQTQLNFYAFPIIGILGNIGNIFIVILFSRHRQNACSIYIISSAILNDIYLTINTLIQIFPLYYGDETISAFAICKMRYYLPNVIIQTARTMFVFACIDRFLITDGRASFRAFSTPKRAKYLFFISIIFWSLFASHMAVMITIRMGKCGTYNIYSTIYTVYITIFAGLIPSITLGMFGYLTYRHVAQRHARIQPITHNIGNVNNNIQRRDRDLLVLVISEVFVYVITTISYPLILLEIMISGYMISNKSILYLQIEGFIVTIMFILLIMNTAAPFYIYLISSQLFRRDFKQLIINSYSKLRRQTLVQTVSRADGILTQRGTRI